MPIFHVELSGEPPPALARRLADELGALMDSAPGHTWVRIVRTGSTIASYKSSNGTSWTLVNSSTNTTFASTCYIGLAVGSGSVTTLNTSQFSNVSVAP